MELLLTARELAARTGMSLRWAHAAIGANRGTDAVVDVDVAGGNGATQQAPALRVRLAAPQGECAGAMAA